MSSWISLYGRFDVTRPSVVFTEYKNAVIKFLEERGGWEDGDEVLLPEDAALVRCFTWDCYDRLDNDYDSTHGLHCYELQVTNARIRSVLIPPRPWGSEGSVSLDVHTEYGQEMWKSPADADMFKHKASYNVLVDGGLRDRKLEDVPYIRMWWCMLGLPFHFMDEGILHIEHGSGVEILLCPHTWEDDGLYEEMFNLSQTIIEAYESDVPREQDLQSWYNWKYVPANGDKFKELMDRMGWRIEIPDKKEAKNG